MPHLSPETILVINCGSSSVKFALIQPQSGASLLTGQVERIGEPGCTLSWKSGDEKQQRTLPDADLVGSLKEVMTVIPEGIRIDAVGHRVVHGAEEFTGSVRIDDSVIAGLEACTPLAPLHNPANLAGIRAASTLFPDKPQVGVFDTAFHQTLPRKAFLYAVPYEWYSEDHFRRYGFHGTSHRYVAEEAAIRLGRPLEELGLITAHLGNGCSACAVEAGKSVDTTMGISPLEGLAMGTRSGDVDPALHGFLAARKGWSLDRITGALNNESGLLGLSGQSNDMRTLVEAAGQGDERAEIAIEVFSYRLAKSIMGLSAALTRLDAIVFTGGIGENSWPVRERVLSQLSVLAPKLDPVLNLRNGAPGTGIITTSDSFPCLVVPTNEELMIARETLALI